MQITDWKQEDIPQITQIEQECFSAAWDASALYSAFALSGACGVAAFEDGALVGYVCGSVLFEDAEIFRVAVCPPYRKKGLGTALTEAFCERAAKRGAERVFLEVRVCNAAAIALYKKCGFENNRLRKKYYENGDDGLEMIKNL